MSTHLPLASSAAAASIGKGYPFRKNPRFRLPTIAGILLVGKFPKPSGFSLTIYYAAQDDFAGVLREILLM